MHSDASSSPAHHYRAYGLDIQSTIALPELESSGRISADVSIERTPVAGPLPANGALRLIQFDADGAYLSWPYIGRFRARHSGQIGVDPLSDNEQHVRFALLGPVFGAYLHQRGTPLLHGSAVAANGQALIFLGNKGAGKSTLAAAFAANGHEVLNDDIIPLRATPSGISLDPGFPSLKLSPSAHAALIPEAQAVDGPQANPAAKVMVSLKGKISGPLPVAGIFILDGRDETSTVERIAPAAALTELLQHIYALKFGENALIGSHGAQLFRLCATLARDVPITRVRVPDEFQQLSRFASSLVRGT